jgi:transcriptional regulator with XRE-family HTH domain
MTSAELKTLREFLGLSVTWLAAKVGVQERTVRHWESGRNPVPDDVAKLVKYHNSLVENVVRETVEHCLSQETKPEEVLLVRYHTDTELWKHRADMLGLPVTFHAAMLQRTAYALQSHNIATTLEYFVPEAYSGWCEVRGLPKNESTRAAWAASQVGT